MQFRGATAQAPGSVGEGDRNIRIGRTIQGQEPNANLLRQCAQLGGQCFPAIILRLPVAFLQIGGNPDFGGSSAGLDQPVDGALQQGGEIGGGFGGRRQRAVGQRARTGQFDRTAPGAFQQDEPAAVLKLPGRLGEKLDGLLAFGDGISRQPRLHAGGAIKHDHDDIRCGRQRPANPAAGQRTGDEQNQEQHGERAHQEDEPLP